MFCDCGENVLGSERTTMLIVRHYKNTGSDTVREAVNVFRIEIFESVL